MRVITSPDLLVPVTRFYFMDIAALELLVERKFGRLLHELRGDAVHRDY